MYHSVTFGEKNTWDDWFLIPTSRPVFNPPKVKTMYVSIPGSNKIVDLTESLTGEATYEYRQGSMEFLVDNGHREWYDLYSDIMDYLHGQQMKAILEDDPSYYYEGRFSVNQWKSEPHNSKIVIDYYVAPFKMERFSSLEDWLWDPFSFETGIIREYANLTIDKFSPVTVIIEPTKLSVVPIIIANITAGSTMTVKYGNVTRNLANGENEFADMIINNSLNELLFVGEGTVSIDYRGGRL